MFGVLLRKQFLELKYTYLKDKKTGKILSGKALFGMSALLIFLFFCIGTSFFAMSEYFALFINTKELMWIMFAIFAFITVILGTLCNMFISKAVLYEAGDNEFLLSLPIPERDIAATRMVIVYFNALIYTAMMWFPIEIHYIAHYGFNIIILFSGVVVWLIISLIVSIFSCLFGYILSLISKLLNNRSVIVTLTTLLFLGIYYYLYFNANRYLTSMLSNVHGFSHFLQTKGFILYIIAKASAGDFLYLSLAFFITVGFALVCFIIVLLNYRKLLQTRTSVTRKKFKGEYGKITSPSKTLFNKEMKHFLSNSTYTINCGLGMVVLVAGAIALIIFRNKISEILILVKLFPNIIRLVPVIALTALGIILSMDCLSVPAVSLEGKHYWIIRSLPIDTYDVLNSKRELQFKLHIWPTLLFAIVSTFVLDIKGHEQVIYLLCCCGVCYFISFFDLYLGIMGANFKWTDEVVPIKRNIFVLIAILCGFVIFAGISLIYYFLCKYVPLTVYLLILIVVLFSASILINAWVREYGTKKFESLG